MTTEAQDADPGPAFTTFTPPAGRRRRQYDDVARPATARYQTMLEDCAARPVFAQIVLPQRMPAIRGAVGESARRGAFVEYHERWLAGASLLIYGAVTVLLCTAAVVVMTQRSWFSNTSVGDDLACLGTSVVLALLLGLAPLSRVYGAINAVAVIGLVIVAFAVSGTHAHSGGRWMVLTGASLGSAVAVVAYTATAAVLYLLIVQRNRRLDPRAIVIIGLLEALHQVTSRRRQWMGDRDAQAMFLARLEAMAGTAQRGLSVYSAQEFGDSDTLTYARGLDLAVAARIRALKRLLVLPNHDALTLLEQGLTEQLQSACLGQWPSAQAPSRPAPLPLLARLRALGLRVLLSAMLIALAYAVPSLFPHLIPAEAQTRFRETVELGALVALLPLTGKSADLVPGAIGQSAKN